MVLKSLLFICSLSLVPVALASGINLIDLLDAEDASSKGAKSNVPAKVAKEPAPAEANPFERPKAKPVEKVVERVVIREVTNVVERVVFREVTNVVERYEHDEAKLKRLENERDRANFEAAKLIAKNLALTDQNKALSESLKAARERNEILSRTLTPQQKKTIEARPAKITAKSTYYDSKDGVAFFSGHVHVDDDQYQLHSEKAYVFMDKEGTNDVKRIVAVGNVAITNETKRAYGVKASYYRDSGMVVLYAAPGGTCQVRDEKDYPPQVVTGSKIKFWLDSDQVEVQGATISAPVTGAGTDVLKTATGK